jgi:hypothetical protein
MKEMILCMLVLAIIIGAANLVELPARHDLSGKRAVHAAAAGSVLSCADR